MARGSTSTFPRRSLLAVPERGTEAMPTSIFVWEYATATLPDVSLPSSIRTEGWAMLAAVVEDFARIDGARVSTILNAAAVRLCQSSCLTVGLAPSRTEAVFDQLAAASDWTLVIAPETEGVLADHCRRVLRAGGRLLGSTPEAVDLAADKVRLGSHLAACGIATPCCHSLSEAEQVRFPAVLKPRDGAGSQATVLVPSREQIAVCVEQARVEGRSEPVLQPYFPGQAVSVAFLIGPRAIVPLLPATQELTDDGRFHYRGGRIPLAGALGARAVELARRAVAVVPGLAGYVGVDLVLGSCAQEHDVVIEINPRLTTSYVGLRALAGFNLAAAMLDLMSGRDSVPPVWHEGAVRFDSSGVVIPDD